MTAPSAENNVAGPRDRAVANPLLEFLLRLGDDRLVLGHRLSQWCGHGPMLEEDIALANIALDLIGQGSSILRLAGEVEGKGRDEDALAYFRDAVDYRNALLVELPPGDFAFTIVRQLLFDTWSVLYLGVLSRSGNPAVAALAAKSLKEDMYHLRHSEDWLRKLGDGTEESHDRAQRALDELWRFTGELFECDAVDLAVGAEHGIAMDHAALRAHWCDAVGNIVRDATLTLPTDGVMATGGRRGRHTEALGHMLAEMQIVARSHPGAKW